MSFFTFLVYFLISAIIYQISMVLLAVGIRYIRYRRLLYKQKSQMKQVLAIVKDKEPSEEDETWH